MRRVGLLILLVGLGCSSELGRETAAERILDHLLAVAPGVLYPDSFRIEVVEILTPDERNREVRYQFIDPEAADDRSEVQSVFFQRTDENKWSIARYGPRAAEQVAWLIGAEWRQRYSELETVLDTLKETYWRWDVAMMDSVARATVPAQRYLSGLSQDQLASRLTTGPAFQGVEWGVEHGGARNRSIVVWVRSAADTAAICAERVRGTENPIHFYWLEGEDRVCRGRGATVVQYAAHDSALAEILRNGGIAYPPSGRKSR